MTNETVGFDKMSELTRWIKFVGYLLASENYAESQQLFWPVKSLLFPVDIQSVLPVNDMLDEPISGVFRPVNVFGKVAQSMRVAENIGINPLPDGRRVPPIIQDMPAELRAGIVFSLCTVRGRVNDKIEFKLDLPSVSVTKFCRDTLNELGIPSRVESQGNDHSLVISGTENLRNLSNLNKKWRVTESDLESDEFDT